MLYVKGQQALYKQELFQCHRLKREKVLKKGYSFSLQPLVPTSEDLPQHAEIVLVFKEELEVLLKVLVENRPSFLL